MPTTNKRPLLGWSLAAVVALALVWLVTAFQLFYNVHPPTPTQADAVVMLGGASKERLLDAMLVRSEIDAPYLVLSNTDTKGNATADEYCDTHSNKAIYPDVICFMPSSMDTRGEADVIGQLATQYGWDSIVVVTSKYHVVRSERLMRQCTPSKVQMVATEPQLSAGQWLKRFVIESAGLATVIVNPECDSPIR
ncbi:YdcF family protein [Specibacter sp. NPDC057265]|uniref:YdcF family protein n=1 Tax=Specibacter sp. NPDC057265 TaxID=3346075 RepID=UPI00363D86F1